MGSIIQKPDGQESSRVEDLIARAARDLAMSSYAIALTGAGISTESGIPDFRGPNGIWTRNPEAEKKAYQSYARFQKNPKEYWIERLTGPSLLGALDQAAPNPGHHALAELERMGVLKCVITQNIDNLHQKAGSRKVLDYHGNISLLRCFSCNRRYDPKTFDLERMHREDLLPPLCGECGGVLKSDVVHFHEPIPMDVAQQSQVEAPYILLVGNDMDHKFIMPTLELLTDAFPFQRFKALGSKKSTGPLVTALPSGLIPEDEVEQLYAEAQAIVFPSFYEGFGIPLLKGLSYGRTVIARNSELLCEIAARHRGPGRLIGYDTPTRLVEVIGRLLHGLPVADMPLGTLLADGEEPMDWLRIARNLLEFVEDLSNHVNTRRWLARERAVRQFSAVKPERRRI